MNSRKSLVIILIVVAIIALLYFLKPKNENAGNNPGKKMGDKPMPVAVNVSIAKQINLDNTLYVTGNVLANEQADLKSEISGRIIKIYFKEGSRVSKGDMLVKIYDEDLQAQLKKMNYQQELASLDESRQKKLLAVNGISQQDYDKALNTLNQVKADIEVLKTQIEKTEIRAPFSGIVGLRYASEGSYITPLIIIASIVQLDPIKIEFSIPEKYADLLSRDNKINFKTDGSSQTYSATVYATEPKIEEAAGTMKVRATCANPDNKIIPGSFVHVTLNLKQYNNAVMIPTQAVIPQLKGSKVYLCKDGKAFSQNVTLGLRNDSTVQIIEGVNAGDTVVVTGILTVRPGTPLKIFEMKEVKGVRCRV